MLIKEKIVDKIKVIPEHFYTDIIRMEREVFSKELEVLTKTYAALEGKNVTL